ncbi:MAG: hypothetical protein JWP42_1725 [Pseudomonas sp.]|nr:hypothetical protein [Pseudomonas sp.]
MPPESASGAAMGFGLKSGLFAAAAASLVSLLAVVIGFTVVPLAPGRELLDAGRRLAAGLLCSFTLGPVLAFKAIDSFPWLLTPWQAMLKGEPILTVYLAAAAPFIAVTAVAGFWIVAALMRWFTVRAGKDIGEIVADVRAGL